MTWAAFSCKKSNGHFVDQSIVYFGYTACCIFMTSLAMVKFEYVKASFSHFYLKKIKHSPQALMRMLMGTSVPVDVALKLSMCTISSLSSFPLAYEVLISATCAKEFCEASKDSSDSVSELSSNEQAWNCYVSVPKDRRKLTGKLKWINSKGEMLLATILNHHLLLTSCSFCYPLGSDIHYYCHMTSWLSHLSAMANTLYWQYGQHV